MARVRTVFRCGADDPEVTVVDRRDGVDPESLGHGNDRGINETEQKVGVLLDQLRATRDVGLVSCSTGGTPLAASARTADSA